MAEDLLDAIRAQLADFAVGLVMPVVAGGGEVLGSGVLVSIEGRRGILTCGHVAERYQKRPDIGVARFIAGTEQRSVVSLGGADHIIVESSDKWTDKDLDLAFTHLSPDVAGSLAAKSVFLNIEKNRERIKGGEPVGCRSVDVMFGLVEEYSEPSYKVKARVISPIRAVIYSGAMHSEEKAQIVFQTNESDPAKLPRSFGGLSGGGLWRIHFVYHGDGSFEIIEKRLWGLASYEADQEKNKGVVFGQGWDRIEQSLIPVVREHLKL